MGCVAKQAGRQITNSLHVVASAEQLMLSLYIQFHVITLTQKLWQAAITTHPIQYTCKRTHARRSNEIKSSHHNNKKNRKWDVVEIDYVIFLSLSLLLSSSTVCFHLKCNYSSSCSKLNLMESLSHRSSYIFRCKMCDCIQLCYTFTQKFKSFS